MLLIFVVAIGVGHMQFRVDLCRLQEGRNYERQIWPELLAQALADASTRLEHERDLRVVGFELSTYIHELDDADQ